MTEGERATKFLISQEIYWALCRPIKWFFWFFFSLSEGMSGCFRWQHCVWFPWRRICGTKLQLFCSLPVLSCGWQINPKVGSLQLADIPFNRHSGDSVERRSGFTVERIRAGGGHFAALERAESWTFPVGWKVGAPSRGTWHPCSPRLDGCNSLNHLLTVEIVNHTSLFSKLNPCLLVAADFLKPVLTVKKGIFISTAAFYRSLSFFFFYKTRAFATSTYLNSRESTETIEVWFNRCFNSPFTVPFRHHREAVSAWLLQFLTHRLQMRIEFDKMLFNAQYSEMHQDKLI